MPPPHPPPPPLSFSLCPWPTAAALCSRQGGDHTAGDGTGGDSLWGGAFRDEFDSRLVHGGRGTVSMANSGKNSNKSQFFICFRAARHLDNTHAVFAKVRR